MNAGNNGFNVFHNKCQMPDSRDLQKAAEFPAHLRAKYIGLALSTLLPIPIPLHLKAKIEKKRVSSREFINDYTRMIYPMDFQISPPLSFKNL
ncbi:hypothetical protein [Paenibacillus riograndensis]|uniref:hypothetical protein n=1 Tax=Paenibacillus riograndensis TaxID=483937 RepID=UPI000AA62CD2|nr:hypothetical protein [Paenibacillus riograndensis]